MKLIMYPGLLLLLSSVTLLSSCGSIEYGTASADAIEAASAPEETLGRVSWPAPDDTLRSGDRLPSVGQLRISIIFARFEGDERELSDWPERPGDSPEQVPDWMNGFINTGRADNFRANHYENITNYFRQSSGGAFEVVGDTYFVSVPDSFQGRRYGEANKHLIQELFGDGEARQAKVDIDHAEADQWNSLQRGVHIREANGIIDYLIVIYRQPAQHPFNARWNGIAALGAGTFPISGNLTVRSGGNNVSGSTVLFKNIKDTFGLVVHEIGHHLVGSPHPYKGSGGAHPAYWGIFHTFLSNQSINAYEREYLGWIDMKRLNEGTETIELGDYYTTGDALAYELKDGTLMIFENRQKLSRTRGADNTYDMATVNEQDKGLFVYRMDPPYSHQKHNLWTLPADGHHSWNLTGLSRVCGSQHPQPVLAKAGPNPLGISYRDALVMDVEHFGMQGDNPFALFIFHDIDPERCHTYTRGAHFDTAFGPGSTGGKRLFSSFTNPASLDEDGNYAGISFYVSDTAGADGELSITFSEDPFFRDSEQALSIEQDIFFWEDTEIPVGAELQLTANSAIHVDQDAVLQINGRIVLPGGEVLTGRYSFDDLAQTVGLTLHELTELNPHISREPLD